MKIAIIGGTGFTGTNVAREARSRGWDVRSLSRSAPAQPVDGVEYRTGTYTDPAAVDAFAGGADALIVAVHAADTDGAPVLLRQMPAIGQAARDAGARLGVVGGAGSSLVAEGGPRLVDTPEFQDAWKPEALAQSEVLDWLRAQDGLRWFYVSPAARYGAFAPGEATGTYREGGDVLVSTADGTSQISGADYALAFADEIAQPKHENRRFTVGY